MVILGPSGAGKGTQAQVLTEHFGVKHISTGDILREEVKRSESALCRAVKRMMDRGDLIPDELILSVLEGVLTDEENFMLDGFPRTYAQAHALDAICERLDTPITVAVSIECPDDEIIRRITGRLVCGKCASMYHELFLPPKVQNTCDKCGNALSQRPDDTAITVKNRLKIFHSLTEPVIDFYDRKGILVRINGLGDAKEISKNLIKALEEKINGHNN